jgi:hypothetical protein
MAFVTKFDTNGNLVYSTYLGGTTSGALQQGNGIAVDSATGNVFVGGLSSATNFPVTTNNAFQTTNKGGEDAVVSELDSQGKTLLYSTYLGGSKDDLARALAFLNGKVWITGIARSQDFPTTAGVVQGSASSQNSCFVACLNPSASGASSLVFSTYVCGNNNTNVTNGIAVDSSENSYVTGMTSNNADFPITPGAAGSTFFGGVHALEAFVFKLNPTGSKYVYSTLIAGSQNDTGNAVAVDASGNAFVAGQTGSANFPVTSGAFQTTFPAGNNNPSNTHQVGFVTKVNPTGTAYVYSTYLGGNNVNKAQNTSNFDQA